MTPAIQQRSQKNKLTKRKYRLCLAQCLGKLPHRAINRNPCPLTSEWVRPMESSQRRSERRGREGLSIPRCPHRMATNRLAVSLTTEVPSQDTLSTQPSPGSWPPLLALPPLDTEKLRGIFYDLRRITTFVVSLYLCQETFHSTPFNVSYHECDIKNSSDNINLKKI